MPLQVIFQESIPEKMLSQNVAKAALVENKTVFHDHVRRLFDVFMLNKNINDQTQPVPQFCW